ncbi:MAG: signal peptide peptidase SppA [Chitinivibrionales bacterium]|nr:signal peptide peptidase SppA [Chitinivibrionales bacterium]
MKSRQKLLIALLILLPVLIGIVVITSGDGAGSALALQKKIGLVRITDVIYSSDKYTKQLRKFRNDNSVAGVILRINSPGGTVAPSQEIYYEILRFRDSNKPVVVSMENVAASGGYYIACAAHRLFANPGTLTGSFGVYMRFPHFYRLSEKIGIDMTTIKAGEFKDLGNPHRKITEEEKKLLQNLLSDTHDQFIEDIAYGRSLDIDSVRALADGRIFTGRQALHLGLVDTLGGYQDAATYIKSYCGLPEKTKIIENRAADGLWKNLLTDAMNELFPFLQFLGQPAGSYFLFDGFLY